MSASTGAMLRRGCRWPALLLSAAALAACGGPAAYPPQQPQAPVVQTPAVPAVPVQPPAPAEPSAEMLQALGELADLQDELRKLRAAVDEIGFNADTTRRRQQNLLQDLDRRLLALERAQRLSEGPAVPSGLATVDAAAEVVPAVVPGAAVAGADSGDAASVVVADTPGGQTLAADAAAEVAAAGDVAPAVPDSADVADAGDAAPEIAVSVEEQTAYDNAFDLLKRSQYQESIDAFERLVEAWPDGQLADDAYYWMSEARYVNREFEAALNGFNTVVTRFPESSRVPEAVLKTGYIQYDIGAYNEAAEIFREILERYPGHQVEVAAQTRLRRIEQTIQQ